MKGAKAKGKAENKLAVKAKPTKKTKAAKDPNKPKRPPSAFFVFMEDFRVSYKKKNPANKSVSEVGKAGGAKWKTMTEAEKAPYVATAEKRKKEYGKKLKEYENKQSNATAEEEESDKSKSEVNDDEDDEDGSDDADEDDDSD
ncbi:unnamed protein product [Cuscuta epithymum]|uniref:HMG box domain-containing protein n=1 Tax=Cuscuta epithymum TaxID=186058 RepID=A0AAV0G781_9ASTE|nr:unnamed protein product [Cuscuta epithymum]CAH9143104.1 unnamed protein product [Cuscuta epithymum]